MKRTTAGLLGVLGALGGIALIIAMLAFPWVATIVLSAGVLCGGWFLGQEFLSD